MYLRCDNCKWEQDDFWSYNFSKREIVRFLTFKWLHRPFGYNPESVLMEDIAEWLPPRKVKMDYMAAKEKGFDTNEVHSWWFLKEAFKRYFKVRKTMKWKTFEKFKKDKEKGKAFCPRCGNEKYWTTD